jgi:hypothetical protein
MREQLAALGVYCLSKKRPSHKTAKGKYQEPAERAWYAAQYDQRVPAGEINDGYAAHSKKGLAACCFMRRRPGLQYIPHPFGA